MSLPLHEVFSISDKGVKFIDDETVVFRSGNTIVYLNVISKDKSVITFEPGQSIDCFSVVRNPVGGKLAVATHGVRNEIHLFNYPEATPYKIIQGKGKMSFGLISLDRLGERLATISRFGASFLTLWDLESGEPMLETPVADDYSFMSFNPFNKNQLCCGHAKRLTIWNLVTPNPYTKPFLQSIEVSMDVSSKIERQVLSHVWVSDNKLVCSSPTGELLLCNIAQFLEDRAAAAGSEANASINAVVAAQRAAINQTVSSSSAPVGAGGQAKIAAVGAIQGLGDRVRDSRQAYAWETHEQEEKIVLSVVASRLPFAPDNEEMEADQTAKRGRWSANKGAVVYGMAATRDYLVVGTEDGSVLWLTYDNYRVARIQRLRGREGFAAIGVVDFSPSFRDFITVNLKGALHLTRVDTKISIESTEADALQTFQLGTYNLAFGYRTGEPIGCNASVLPQLSTDFTNGMRLCTYNNSGNLCLWAISSKQLICSYDFKAVVTSVSPSPDGLLIAVGLSTGVLAFMDATSPISLRLVYAVRFHNTAVTKVAFSPEGDIVASMSKERVYFVRPSDFKVLGRVELYPILRTPAEKKARKAALKARVDQDDNRKKKDELESDSDDDDDEDEPTDDVDMEPSDGVVDLIWLGYDNAESKFHRIVISTRACRAIVFNAPNSYFEDSDSVLRVPNTHLKTRISALPAKALSMVASNRESSRSNFIAITDTKMLQRFRVDASGECLLDLEVMGHPKVCTKIAISPSGVIATTGRDGTVMLRDLQTLQVHHRVPCHDFHSGGGNSVVFTEDCRHLVSTGADGGIFVWDVSTVDGDSDPALTYKTALSIREKVLESLEVAIEPQGDIPLFNAAVYSESDSPDAMSSDVVDSRQKGMRDRLLKSIERFRGIFDEVLQRNENAPEEERLGLREFAVDVELRDQLIKEGRERTEAIRKEMTNAFRGKQLVAQRIKEQCWDSMKVKGEMFRAFKSGVEINNFPIRERTAAETKRLRQIQFQRKMQCLEQGFLTSDPAQTGSYFDPTKLTAGAEYLVKMGEKKAGVAAETFPDFLLFNPVECVTNVRKRMQAYLLSSKIEDLKTQFNKAFKQTFGLKEVEIENIHEKNKRINEIQSELGMPLTTFEAVISEDEVTDSVLKVDDSEIKSERVLNKEEQAIYDAKMEAERIKALNRDDAPDRALMDFMGGTLEKQGEISLLDQEIPREEWMDMTQEDMSDEQKAELADYERKVAQLNEAKEDRRKLLQTELQKLTSDVAEVYQSFDEATKDMLTKRVTTLGELYQHELMIIRIINDLGKHEKQEEEELAIQERLVVLRREKKVAKARAMEFQDKFNNFVQTYEELVNEERLSEKMFRKEFSDAGDQIDLLVKLFRQGKRSNQQAKKANPAAPKAVPAGEEGADADAEGREVNAVPEEEVEEKEVTLSPFPEDNAKEAATKEEDAFGEQMPEEFDPDKKEIWYRFLEKQKEHAELETKVLQAGKAHEEMHHHLVALQSRDAAIDEEIVALEERYDAVQENRSRLALDTEVMVQTLQGMVEIEEAPVVTDLKDCEMIERRMVEDLNTLIKASGREKVDILKEIMVSRSAINLLKWTKKKLSLEHKDAVDLTTELQLLRVTKNLQLLIKMGGHDNQKAAELKRLDRKIEFLNHAMREKTLGKKLKLMQIKKKIRQQKRENSRLLLTVEELEAAVRERVQISNIRGGDAGDDRKSADRRMKALVTRRKLVDLAKLQAEEIKFLRDQVESLRKRTFASFAVPHIPANPDEVRHENYPDLMRSTNKLPPPPPSAGGSGGFRAVTR